MQPGKFAGNFTGLPDIDLSSKDVYETPDIEDLDPSETENNEHLDPSSRRSSIDQGVFSTESAFKRFENEVIDARDTDFSDRVDKFSTFNTYSVNETLDARISRLKREIEEIKVLKEQQEEKGHEQINTKQEKDLDGLREILENLEVNTKLPLDEGKNMNLLKDLKPENEESKSIISQFNPLSKQTTPDKKVINKFILLENRITKLENLLGPQVLEMQTISNNSTNQPIRTVLNQMSKKITILDSSPKQLEELSTKIEKLYTQSEKIITSRHLTETALLRSSRLTRSTTTTTSILNKNSNNNLSELEKETNLKINELYNKLSSLESISSNIPFIYNRLKSLKSLHLDIGSSVDSIHQIENNINSINLDIKKWEKSLTDVEKKLENHNDKLVVNKQEIKEWIEDLQKRVDKIEK